MSSNSICGQECYQLIKADIKSLNFVVIYFLMKLFESANGNIINDSIII